MTTRHAKRFYKSVSVAQRDGFYNIQLDGKSVRTPLGHLLELWTRDLAQAIADEWSTQGGEIDLETMPFTRLAFAAVDVVAPVYAEVGTRISGYAKADVLCYRADAPAELAKRQREIWDPILDWASDRYGARLTTAQGLTPVLQPEEALEKLGAQVRRFDDFTLAAMRSIVGICGSFVLGLAIFDEYLPAREAFAAALLDEDFQAERWGRDAEAEARRARMLAELEAAERFMRLATLTSSPHSPASS